MCSPVGWRRTPSARLGPITHFVILFSCSLPSSLISINILLNCLQKKVPIAFCCNFTLLVDVHCVVFVDMSDTSATSPDVSGSTETHDDQSPTVCYLCRQRKTKCDRNLPRCGYCIKAKVNCQYVAQPRKRGLRAGYVSELEARLGTSSLAVSFSDPNGTGLITGTLVRTGTCLVVFFRHLCRLPIPAPACHCFQHLCGFELTSIQRSSNRT